MSRKLKLLREWVGVNENELSDEDLLKITKGTLIEAKIQLKIAEDRLKQSINKAIEDDMKKIRKIIVGESWNRKIISHAIINAKKADNATNA